MNDLYKVIEQKIINTISPPKDQVRRPHNRLWIALVAFNLIFFPLDIATGVTVGLVTVWYYGLWVFGAGFGTMVIHEALFSNAYAKWWQKGISVLGFTMSIGVTLLIGVAAIALNLLWEGYDKDLAGFTMSAVSFAILFLHGILIAAYYFTDSGFISRMKQTSALAESDRMVSEMAMANVLVQAVNRLTTTLTSAVERGDGRAMGAALNKITGNEWDLPGADVNPQPGRGQ